MADLMCELNEKIWAAAIQSEVVGIDLTYNEAVGVVNQNLDKTGIAIITAEAARRQLELRGQRNGSNRTTE